MELGEPGASGAKKQESVHSPMGLCQEDPGVGLRGLLLAKIKVVDSNVLHFKNS